MRLLLLKENKQIFASDNMKSSNQETTEFFQALYNHSYMLL